MNVYVTNCKDNMIEVCKAFFLFAFFQMKINSIPTYFSKRACSTKDLFYRKKKHIKEF